MVKTKDKNGLNQQRLIPKEEEKDNLGLLEPSHKFG